MGSDEGLTSRSYGEIFEQLCPYYMSIGMSYDEYWDGDVEAVKAYRQADELRKRQRNFELWLQGKYMYDALCSTSPLFRFTMKSGTIKPEPYTKEPYPTTASELRELEERRQREMEERLKAQFAAFAERVRKKMSKETLPDDGR